MREDFKSVRSRDGGERDAGGIGNPWAYKIERYENEIGVGLAPLLKYWFRGRRGNCGGQMNGTATDIFLRFSP
jgi:hypothetical protein